MTVTFAPAHRTASGDGHERFTLHRAGILNVWQYDEQEFHFSDGRLLLRGANGAGKSKTLEMLLPFVLDGDKARITASAKHHTSLLWLMTDGYEGQARIGYVWVEFARVVDGTIEEVFTCGVGIRASTAARTATAWHFTTTRRIGHDLSLEDEAGPLTRARLEEELGEDGQVFEKAAAYKEHVGRALFGLDVAQYDEVLRLLYWLRQPQVGEDIEPAKLAIQLSQALPALDEQAVRAAGDTFDELAAFGEQIQRRAAAAEALGDLARAYEAYARAAVADRARTAAAALAEERRLRTQVKRTEADAAQIDADLADARAARDVATAGVRDDQVRLATLQDSPEFRSQQRLDELGQQATRDADVARAATANRERRDREAQRRGDAHDKRREQVGAQLREYADTLRDLDRRQRQAVPGSSVTVPAMFEGLELQAAEQVPAITAALDHSHEAVNQARAATAVRTAGVELVRRAAAEVDKALAAQSTAEDLAERAERRWEQARQARRDADLVAQEQYDALDAALRSWAPEVTLPDDLTEEIVTGLPQFAAALAQPRLTGLRDDRASASARQQAAAAQLQELMLERAAVEAERDPSPPAPVLPRTARPDGLALWQVIDFADSVTDEQKAGLEAALQSSGLLDAWVRPGGRLLDTQERDVVLAGSGAVEDSLCELLVPDVPPESDVSAEDVTTILQALGTRPQSQTRVSPDGQWRLGPAHGHASKDTAQYIGATARAQERSRRLALLDAQITDQDAARAAAEHEIAELSTLIADLEAWVAAVPSGAALLKAWNTQDERLRAEAREEDENRAAQNAAHGARAHTASARAALEHVAAQQQLPTDPGSLAALEQELRSVDEAAREALRRDPGIRQNLGLWSEAADELAHATAERVDAQAAEADATREAQQSQARFEALRASLGDSIQELQRRIDEVRASKASHERSLREANSRAEELTRASGQAQAESANARARLTDHLDVRAAALDGLIAVASVPGMIEAAGVSIDDAGLLDGLEGLPPTEAAPKHVAATAQRLAQASDDDPAALDTRVWTQYRDASSGPAADHQPTVAKFGELLAVTGRDDAGEAAIVNLARRVRASVDSDRDLLTEREKEQFEQHILGELGDAIRQCRRDAVELIRAMNEQLGNVTTTQGIRVKLSWDLRDDVPPEAAAAVKLLAQPVGALLPEERAALRDALHRLIEASRAERPEASYGEHLSAALDYRTWSVFSIRYTRPEKPGHWEKLHKKSPLSQGEQKVLCYLPLFAAAAAHFTSLAGAAPHAPRLVLLDDAFPKIDVRTHPLLFGLLVQLDLDFVITSERLWGDHDSVPSLSIYEALRDPSERGIAQYHYEWDGRALHSLG